MRLCTPLLVLGLSVSASTACLADLTPTQQARFVHIVGAFQTGGGYDLNEAAADFDLFDIDLSGSTQRSGFNPGALSGVFAVGHVRTSARQDDASGDLFRTAESSFQATFSTDETLPLTGHIAADFNGVGGGFAELDVRVTLQQQGGSTQTWSIAHATSDPFSEDETFSATVSPGTWTLTARAFNRNVPFNTFSPAISTSDFDVTFGVPEPATAAAILIGLCLLRRR